MFSRGLAGPCVGFAHLTLTFSVAFLEFVTILWFFGHPLSPASVLHESEARPPGPRSPIPGRAGRVFRPRGRAECGQDAKETNQLLFGK